MPPTLGQRLRRAREGRGWQLDEIAHKTRIPMQRLQELEEDNLNGCGGMTYAKSFLRTYSGLLEVDASEILGQIQTPPLGGTRDYRYLLESHGHWVDDYRNTPAMVPAKNNFPGKRSFGLVPFVGIVAFVLMGLTLGVHAWNSAKQLNQKTALDKASRPEKDLPGATVANPSVTNPPGVTVRSAQPANAMAEDDPEFVVFRAEAVVGDSLAEFRDHPADTGNVAPPKGVPVR